jgi:large subunit ribosomal protein L24
MKVKKGDMVLVISGRDKGARGRVLTAMPKIDKIIVEGINRVKKHTRIRTTQRGAKTGGIVTQEAAIHVSNVMVIDSDGKPTRVGFRVDDNGVKIRVSRR